MSCSEARVSTPRSKGLTCRDNPFQSTCCNPDRPPWRSVHYAAMSGRFATPIAVGRGYEGNGFQCPSETTSTVPSVTLMAVWSSMAYAGPAISAAHLSASAIELPGMPS
jgi:hypothetical protein